MTKQKQSPKKRLSPLNQFQQVEGLRLLAHELAHESFQNLSLADQTSYQEQNGWSNPKFLGGTDKWFVSRQKFVELDGKDSPEEDYANNVQYFLFHPTKLSFLAPIAYEWIKNHFGDKFVVKGRK